jgi:hypothetical protein
MFRSGRVECWYRNAYCASPPAINVTVTSDDARLAVGRYEARGGAIGGLGRLRRLDYRAQEPQVGATCLTISTLVTDMSG